MYCSIVLCCFRGLRWAAYRQCTAWVYGKLGWKIRHPIPSCVVTKLRQLFPLTAEEEEYVGFHEADSDGFLAD